MAPDVDETLGGPESNGWSTQEEPDTVPAPTTPDPPEVPESAYQARGRRRTAHLYWIAWAGLLVAIIGAIIGAVLQVSAGDGKASEEPAGGRLELSEAVVRNGPAVYRSGAQKSVQTQASMPAIDLTLLNNTPQRVLITSARVQIESYASLHVCATQGGGDTPVAGRYALKLPLMPQPRERRLVKPLHQQIGPGEADRFVLRFADPEFTELDWNMYALHVWLKATSSRSEFDAGRFLLVTPGPIDRFGSALPEDNAYLGGAPQVPKLTSSIFWCFRHNVAEVRRMLDRPGHRSEQVAALSGLPVASRWPRLVQRRSPRTDVARLLDVAHGDPYRDPVLALFAAQQARDPTLVRQVRERSLHLLLAGARRGLRRDDLWAAIHCARSALVIADLPEARGLLAEAQRRRSGEQRHASTA